MNRELLMLVDAISREKNVEREIVFGAAGRYRAKNVDFKGNLKLRADPPGVEIVVGSSPWELTAYSIHCENLSILGEGKRDARDKAMLRIAAHDWTAENCFLLAKTSVASVNCSEVTWRNCFAQSANAGAMIQREQPLSAKNGWQINWQNCRWRGGPALRTLISGNEVAGALKIQSEACLFEVSLNQPLVELIAQKSKAGISPAELAAIAQAITWGTQGSSSQKSLSYVTEGTTMAALKWRDQSHSLDDLDGSPMEVSGLIRESVQFTGPPSTNAADWNRVPRNARGSRPLR